MRYGLAEYSLVFHRFKVFHIVQGSRNFFPVLYAMRMKLVITVQFLFQTPKKWARARFEREARERVRGLFFGNSKSRVYKISSIQA